MSDKEGYFRAARTMMVDGQIRPNNIADDRIIIAMRTIRRERFCPSAQANRAYADADLPLGGGRFMPAPLSVARLAYFAAVAPGARVLVVGANTGYCAAVLASCGAVVTALEEDAGLRAAAAEALAAEAPEVRLVGGALAAGAPAAAPFDVIVIEGMVDALPEGFAAQLAPGGRLVCVLREGGIGRLVVAEAVGGRFAHRAMADCNMPALAAFERKIAFSF
ncbi:MAG TPA: protein-L-isoaspartate(D-aspartate) O-methyltransferase [Acidiphilium sp.]|nr:protein-L-isoaspartate(D-aspartate) O-methyltransferase [Acidiphilium sp.]